MSCEDGMVYRVDAVRGGQTVLPVKLASGGMAVYLFSDTPREVRHAASCGRLSARRLHRRACVGADDRPEDAHACRPRTDGTSRSTLAVQLLRKRPLPHHGKARPVVGTALLDLGEVGYWRRFMSTHPVAPRAQDPTPDGFGCSVTFDASCSSSG